MKYVSLGKFFLKKPSNSKLNISQHPANNPASNGSQSGSSSPWPCSSTESSDNSSNNSEIQSVIGDDDKQDLDEDIKVLDSRNNPILDWSRHGRKQRVVEAVGSDPSQSCILDYFTLTNEIDVFIRENEKLSSLLRQAELNNLNYQCHGFDSFPTMLQHLICNAEKVPEGRRHLEIIKKFATSLFIYTGPFAYHFLQQNVTMVLPSLRSVQGYIYSEYSIISEGVLDLMNYPST